MATVNKTEAAKEEYVDLFIDRGYEKDDPNEFISVNGVNYLLPKGKTSRVPVSVKKEYERSRRARETQLSNAEALLEKASEPINK